MVESNNSYDLPESQGHSQGARLLVPNYGGLPEFPLELDESDIDVLPDEEAAAIQQIIDNVYDEGEL